MRIFTLSRGYNAHDWAFYTKYSVSSYSIDGFSTLLYWTVQKDFGYLLPIDKTMYYLSFELSNQYD